MKVIESILAESSDNPYNTTAHALISASIDEHIHLDGVYFLLRREPDVLPKLLSSSVDGSTSDGNSVCQWK